MKGSRLEWRIGFPASYDREYSRDCFVYRIYRFLSKSNFLYIGIYIVFLSLLSAEESLLTLWVSIIFLAIFMFPPMQRGTAWINLSFCCDPVLRDGSNKLIRKKVTLKARGRKFFFGYDREGNMILPMLILQGVLLGYIGVFLIVSFVFLLMFITDTASQAVWIRIWYFEGILLLTLAIVISIFFYTKIIWRW